MERSLAQTERSLAQMERSLVLVTCDDVMPWLRLATRAVGSVMRLSALKRHAVLDVELVWQHERR
jgi:hypothetical protein